MVPKKSRFCPKGPNFAIVASFRAKSQIPNPVSERLDSDDDGDDNVGKKGVTINLSKHPKIPKISSSRSLKKGGLSLNGQQILLR